MIAKFHSAPGHSMETTLTISLPPPQSVRAARGEQPRERQKEQGKERKREREEDQERERVKERDRTHEREKEMKEHDRERTGKSHSDKTVSYKDKFQRMRERYDRVTASQEVHQRDLDILNAKIRKMQAENDLLLDAMYLADASLYERYFPGHLPTPPAIAPNSLPIPIPNQPPPQQRFPEHYPPPPPQHPHPQYSSTMPPPGSMPPPPLSSSSTSIPPGLIPPSLPPHPLLPSPSMTMPPPSSGSNGVAVNNGATASRRHSNASSSRSRRRSDARGSIPSTVGIPLAPEDLGANTSEHNGGRTPRQTVTPTASAGMDAADDPPLRSPRVNGAPAATLDRRTPSALTNGASPTTGSHQAENSYPVSARDGEMAEPETFPDEPPAVDDSDSAAYNMNAYAAVNSPDDPDEDMHVDG